MKKETLTAVTNRKGRWCTHHCRGGQSGTVPAARHGLQVKGDGGKSRVWKGPRGPRPWQVHPGDFNKHLHLRYGNTIPSVGPPVGEVKAQRQKLRKVKHTATVRCRDACQTKTVMSYSDRTLAKSLLLRLAWAWTLAFEFLLLYHINVLTNSTGRFPVPAAQEEWSGCS